MLTNALQPFFCAAYFVALQQHQQASESMHAETSYEAGWCKSRLPVADDAAAAAEAAPFAAEAAAAAAEAPPPDDEAAAAAALCSSFRFWRAEL